MPTEPAPVKVAVMSFAHVHAAGYVEVLKRAPGVELLSSDPGPHAADGELRGRELADRLGVGHVDTYEELLAWGPDAVVITSETSRHRELVERATAAGAHVLCEKPLATTREDALAIAAAVQRAGTVFMMAFPVRFSSSFARLRAAHDGGGLGEVFSVRGSNNGMLPTSRSWFTDPELAGGGALTDHVVHIADLLEALRGCAPASVTAVTNRVLHADRARAETAGLVTVTYTDGVVAAIDCSWSQPDTAPTWGGLKLSVAGTGGTVDVDFFGPSVRGLDGRTGRPIQLPYGADTDEAVLATFLDAVRTGSQPQPDLAVGMRTLDIVLAAQESAATGRTVTLAGV
ncbi:Gfo/Idh/MocA family protein [Kineococcus sp. SYSU DK002]|uniref:Gfo/Idh/MocA family protein n=1 Tax=Kineococcus sp. SYSU DK002 TaxID=3383123 RepID=UPI003D7C747D